MNKEQQKEIIHLIKNAKQKDYSSMAKNLEKIVDLKIAAKIADANKELDK